MKKPGGLGLVGDEILPSYVGFFINHYKDPYERTGIMESNSLFFVFLRGLNGGKVFMVKVQKCENSLKQNFGGVS